MLSRLDLPATSTASLMLDSTCTADSPSLVSNDGFSSTDRCSFSSDLGSGARSDSSTCLARVRCHFGRSFSATDATLERSADAGNWQAQLGEVLERLAIAAFEVVDAVQQGGPVGRGGREDVRE